MNKKLYVCIMTRDFPKFLLSRFLFHQKLIHRFVGSIRVSKSFEDIELDKRLPLWIPDLAKYLPSLGCLD